MAKALNIRFEAIQDWERMTGIVPGPILRTMIRRWGLNPEWVYFGKTPFILQEGEQGLIEDVENLADIHSILSGFRAMTDLEVWFKAVERNYEREPSESKGYELDQNARILRLRLQSCCDLLENDSQSGHFLPAWIIRCWVFRNGLDEYPCRMKGFRNWVKAVELPFDQEFTSTDGQFTLFKLTDILHSVKG